ncbi:GreA/GreB family elongation factor [Hymenobacter sp. BT770]|uniref:GreA/GreB family elongation factor n=1 Tax=Hymenobacter sp. BT770 TaxID=2886942 RepID=UPI001D112784|nr:GreA/GreB family elongation factor [Hymenobacter sp. BT770]MCC3151690.1 GreA/GreB family elongation factor [Hymenobacter sp. BT770]MDO3413732.1 GreA/GreB family elongation factor [Hymenobacter sp. BT770]
MSRGFVKEDDSQQPPIIPPRAALPPDTPNYVTPNGLEQLRAELTALEAERAQAEGNRDNDTDRTHRLSLYNGRIALLTERITSAKVVDPHTQPPKEVRFGATVALRTVSGGTPGSPSAKAGFERKFTIVGVDEADLAEGKVAFVAPIARAVLGAKLGKTVTLKLGPKEEVVEIVGISYADA